MKMCTVRLLLAIIRRSEEEGRTIKIVYGSYIINERLRRAVVCATLHLMKHLASTSGCCGSALMHALRIV